MALSGGAAASAAHVGVIRAFEEAGYVITHMSGTREAPWSPRLWATGYGGQELSIYLIAWSGGILTFRRAGIGHEWV
ncbi:MAG: hypothetical protein IMX06_07820 [Kyrpidia tusciae]|nr:hypothetical protein [Kyrpidia tusciae]MBE3552750.1 hypothetical protein [Kyrpidia tusciae]